MAFSILLKLIPEGIPILSPHETKGCLPTIILAYYFDFE
jgi:hypothetical protein